MSAKPQKVDGKAIAEAIAAHFSKDGIAHGPPGANAPVPPVPLQPLAPPPEQKQLSPHSLAMRDAAEAAKRKYMADNGVDENGDLIQVAQ